MDGVRFNGWVRLSSNLHRFAFYGGHYYHNGQGHPRTPEGPIATFHVIRTNILYMENCCVSAEQKAEHAMSATYGSFVEAHDCYFDRGLRNGAQAIRGSKMYINNCGGRENGEFGAYASINSEIAISGDVVDQRFTVLPGKEAGQGRITFLVLHLDLRGEGSVHLCREERSGLRVAIPENKILTAYPTEVASWRGQGATQTMAGVGMSAGCSKVRASIPICWQREKTDMEGTMPDSSGLAISTSKPGWQAGPSKMSGSNSDGHPDSPRIPRRKSNVGCTTMSAKMRRRIGSQAGS